ncbi:5-formyltetrahydrofolate cyclo-ligase [bacterium]|nr:5-formyltetrahydrofolate cyclo-ligase [bacterium]
MENKIIIRRKVKDLRKNMDIPNISSQIIENIISLDLYKRAKNIMLFYPLKYEINLLKLMEQSPDKSFYLPRMKENNLECCSYNPTDELVCSKYQIFEPKTVACDKNDIDIVFVPALCADKNFNRLGYGGGFYDRFLSDYKNIKICPCINEFLFDEIPSEEYDIKMDLIVTENDVLKK